MENKKKVIAKIRTYGIQKRITVPKQEETKDWEKDDDIELKKVGEEK